MAACSFLTAMYQSASLLLSLQFAIFALVCARRECYSCASNPNSVYYQLRIPGFRINKLPRTSTDCIADPSNINNATILCEGPCYKWQSTQTLQSGGVLFNVLRGCYTDLVNSDQNPSPSDEYCRYSLYGTNENIVECWCDDDLCNFGYRPHSQWLLISLLLFVPFWKLLQ